MAKFNLKSKGEKEEKESFKEGGKIKDSDLNFVMDNLAIDKFNLDKDSEIQIDLMDKIARILPKARDATLRAKNRLEIVEFEMSQEMRKNPKKYGLTKDTDTVIFKAVKTTDEYKKAFNAYLFCKNKEDEFQLLYENVKNRSHLIKYLMELWLNNYYSKPEVYVTRKKRKKVMDMEE